MKIHSSRRTFLKRSSLAGIAAPFIASLEEFTLCAQQESGPGASQPTAPKTAMPTGKIGNVTISRLICGGNLISGYAHSRDLIYVSPLLKHYFTDDKIIETWRLSEQQGINTMILNPSDERAAALYSKYRAGGGRIQYLAQLGPDEHDLKTPVKQAKDAGAVGAFLLGNVGDAWTRDGDVKWIGELLANIKAEGLIAGVAGHEVRTVRTVEQAGFKPDFYMKTLHQANYWSHRRPDETKDVIDNYAIDNYWCRDAKETIAYMSEIERPWIAYKVLAAGAIPPPSGFQHAFNNGADFVAVGMFDFQIGEDAAAAAQAVKGAWNRDRDWFA
jgi:hypothetical protein